MLETVNVAPSFSPIRILRPLPNFEALYQGKTLIPISMPGSLADEAGEQGYSSKLLKGYPVPLGARLLFWFPRILQPSFSEGSQSGWEASRNYQFRLLWRLRAPVLGTSPERERLGHIRRDTLGAPDAGSPRFFLPAAEHVVAFEQTEPTMEAVRATSNLRVEQLATYGATTQLLTPSGNVDALVSQGIYDPVEGLDDAYQGGAAMYQPFFIDCPGDELIVLISRAGEPGETWNFTSTDADLGLAEFFNGPQNGVLLMTGTSTP